MYKYRINELLSELPMKDYKKALKVLPKALGVSLNTFSNYRNIKVDQSQDIPYQKVLLLEAIFRLKAGGLNNVTVSTKSLKELLNDVGK